MIRQHSKFKAPRGLRAKLLSALKKVVSPESYGWQMLEFDELLSAEEAKAAADGLSEAIIDACGTTMPPASLHLLAHTGADCIHSHVDAMSARCFLWVLKASPTTALYQGRQRVGLKPGALLSFNDYLEHGLDNPNFGRYVLVSISL